MAMSSHTRVSQRTSPADLGFIQIFGDDGGKILNISESGLSFESFAPLGESRTLQFWFSLNLRDRIEAMGEIVWLDAGTKIGGLRFVNPSNQVVEHIRFYSKENCPSTTQKMGALFTNILAKQTGAEVARKERAQATYPLSSSPAFDSTELISWQRHKEECRKRFVLGLVVGLFVASITTAAVYRFWAARLPGAAIANESKPSSVLRPGSSDTPFAAPSVPQTIVPASKRSSVIASKLRPASVVTESGAGHELASLTLSAKESGAAAATRGGATPQIPNAQRKTASSQQLWSAVQAGDTNAAVILAERYLRGDGVPANCLQARVLLLVASEKKNADAIKKLDELDKTGCPADKTQ